MPKAVDQHTASRRAFMRALGVAGGAGAVSAAVAGAAPAAMTEAGSADDAALLGACREMGRTKQRVDYLDEHSIRGPFGDPAVLADEEEMSRACQAWHEAMVAVAALPAR